MSLPTHGRYGFSALPDRPVWAWPNGARLAVYVAVNLEVFPFAEGLGVPLANPGPEPDVVNFGWRDRGNRVGVWYLLEALRDHAIPATALLNTALLDAAPRVAQAFREPGDCIVAHGRTNAERQSDMDHATERAMILECRDRLGHFIGAPPRGWMGPWVAETHATPDLLAEAGFDYVMDWPHDDQPGWLATTHGPLLSLPYARPLNDLPALHGAKCTPRAWAEALLDGFEEARRLAARWPLVFNLSLHPYLVGWPERIAALRPVLARLGQAAARGEVWLANSDAIAQAARSRIGPAPPP